VCFSYLGPVCLFFAVFSLFVLSCQGLTENAGCENDGPSKLQA